MIVVNNISVFVAPFTLQLCRNFYRIVPPLKKVKVIFAAGTCEAAERPRPPHLAVAHVGQGLPSLLQVAQAQVHQAIGVAHRLHVALVAGRRAAKALVLRAVRQVAQANAVLGDASGVAKKKKNPNRKK